MSNPSPVIIAPVKTQASAIFPNSDPTIQLNISELQYTSAQLAGIDYLQITIDGKVHFIVKIS